MKRDTVFLLMIVIQLLLTASLLSSCGAVSTSPPPPAPTPSPVPSVTLTWDASPSTNVTGYRIYYGAATGDYTVVKDVGNVLTAVLTNIPTTKIFIAATAYDAVGDESDFSNEVTWPVSVSVAGQMSLNLRAGK